LPWSSLVARASAGSWEKALLTALVALSLLGVAAALVRGGSLAGWARLRIYWWPVAVASLVIQLVLYDPPLYDQTWAITFGPLVWIVCLAALFGVLLRNGLANPTHRGAWLVAALGAGLNVMVVAANGGYMPQSAEARVAVRGTTLPKVGEPAHERLWSVRPIDESTQLAPLGDVIGEPYWLPKSNVVSLGDLLLAAGLTWWAFSVTRRKQTT